MRKLCTFLPLLFATFCLGQQPMNPAYASYVVYTADAVHGYLYQIVVVDGTTTGSCTVTITYVCGPNGQVCTTTYTYQSCLTATHQPKIYNVLNGVGGWSTGPSQLPFTYLSFSTTVLSPWQPGTQLLGSYQGEVVCTAIGVIFLSELTQTNPPPGACSQPTSETSEPVGWAYTTKGAFRATLSPSTLNFDGRSIMESSPQMGTNGCWFDGSGMPQEVQVTGDTWVVAEGTNIGHNQYGLDSFGFDQSGVYTIRTLGYEHDLDFPCTLTYYQDMAMECNTELWWVYVEQMLTQTIHNTPARVDACRGVDASGQPICEWTPN